MPDNKENTKFTRLIQYLASAKCEPVLLVCQMLNPMQQVDGRVRLHDD